MHCVVTQAMLDRLHRFMKGGDLDSLGQNTNARNLVEEIRCACARAWMYCVLLCAVCCVLCAVCCVFACFASCVFCVVSCACVHVCMCVGMCARLCVRVLARVFTNKQIHCSVRS